MEKKELVNILSELLQPNGFKKKGDYWVINGNTISKIVNLQKSSYSNAFYINYGYILNSIPLGNLKMHVYNRITSNNVEERNKITLLLDLENQIPDNERSEELNRILEIKLLAKLQAVNTEEDLLLELKSRPHLNDITLAIKQHFNLPK